MNRAKKLMVLMGGKPKFIKGRFVLLVKSDNAGTSGDTEFTLTGGVGTNYPIDWFEKDNPSYNGSLVGNGAQTIDFGKVGEFYLQVGQPFNKIEFENGGDRRKITAIKKWGNNIWTTLNNAFWGCINLKAEWDDVPNLSAVDSVRNAFLNSGIQTSNSNWAWDFSGVTNMGQFVRSTAFDSPHASNWNVSNVTSMDGLFFDSSNFNQDVSSWNVSNVTNMVNLFRDATAFNQSLETWVLNTGVSLSRSLELCGMSKENFSRTLIGWANDIHERGLADGAFSTTLGAVGRTYDDTVYEGIGNGHFNKATDAVPFLALKGIALAGATDVS